MRSTRNVASGGLVAAIVLLAATVVLPLPGASAEGTDSVHVEPSNPGVTVRSVQEVIATQTSGGGGGRPVRCAFFEPGEDIYGISQVEVPVEGETYSLLCWHSDEPDWTWSPTRFIPEVVYTPAVYDLLVQVLVSEAYAEVTPPFAVPLTSPPRDDKQLVGLPTWMWIDPAAWQPVSATAEVPGVSATVTATPVRVVWDMGEQSPSGRSIASGGDPVTCEGPGQPFDPAGGDDQTSDCSYVFQWDSSGKDDSTFDASATVEWAVSYTASTGHTGDLDAISRTTEFPLTVTQRQAVVCQGDPDGCDLT